MGGAVYAWKIDSKLQEFLNQLDNQKIGSIVAFSTTGLMPFAIWKIRRYAKGAGIKVCRQSLCLKIMMQGHAMLGREGGHFKDTQIKKIEKFTAKVIENVK